MAVDKLGPTSLAQKQRWAEGLRRKGYVVLSPAQVKLTLGLLDCAPRPAFGDAYKLRQQLEEARSRYERGQHGA